MAFPGSEVKNNQYVPSGTRIVPKILALSATSWIIAIFYQAHLSVLYALLIILFSICASKFLHIYNFVHLPISLNDTVLSTFLCVILKCVFSGSTLDFEASTPIYLPLLVLPKVLINTVQYTGNIKIQYT